MAISAHTLRRIAAKLPANVALRSRLEAAAVALLIPATFATIDSVVVKRDTHLEDARRELQALLGELQSALPGDPDVAVLARALRT